MSFSIPPLKPFSSSTAFIGFFDGSIMGEPPLKRSNKLNLFMQGPSGIAESIDLYLENSGRNVIHSGIDLYLKNGQGNNVSGKVDLIVNGYNKASGDITLYLPDPDCCAISDPIFVDYNGNSIDLSPVRRIYPRPKIKHMSNCGVTYVAYKFAVAQEEQARVPTKTDYDYSFSGYLNTFDLSIFPEQNPMLGVYSIKAITIDNCGNSGNILYGRYVS